MEIKNLLKDYGWLILIIAAIIIVVVTFTQPRGWKCERWEFIDENGIERTSTIMDIKILNLMALNVFERTEEYKNWSVVIKEVGENYEIDIYDFYTNTSIHYDLNCIEKRRVESV